MSKLKPYMAYSRGAGPEEGAMLIIANHIREAKKMAWPVLHDWGVEEYTDTGVHLLRSPHVFALADQKKLTADEPHVVECPTSCSHCELWGNNVDADGRCTGCGEYAGDELVELYRVYRQTAVTQEAQP